MSGQGYVFKSRTPKYFVWKIMNSVAPFDVYRELIKQYVSSYVFQPKPEVFVVFLKSTNRDFTKNV